MNDPRTTIQRFALVGIAAFAALGITASSARPEGWNSANNPAKFNIDFIMDVFHLPIFGHAKNPTHQPKPPADAAKVGTPGKSSSGGTDEYGRMRDGDCRDVNAGAMHVIVSNMIGMRGTGIVEDRTWNDEVWNAPIVGYRVTNAERGGLKEVSRDDAAKLVGVRSGPLEFVDVFKETEIPKGGFKLGTFRAKLSGELNFRMTGSGDADLYLRRGSKPTSKDHDAKGRRRGSTSECKINVHEGDTICWGIFADKKSAVVSLAMADVAKEASYSFNPAAVRFFYVKMRLDIGAFAREDLLGKKDDPLKKPPKQPEPELRQDTYQYVLEADANGKILGGEWVGESKKQHPDFLWAPGHN